MRDPYIKIITAVNSPWIGLIVDTGNFRTADPYAEIEKVIPYAVNWQVKESVFGPQSEIPADYKRLVKIIVNNRYRGYLPVETLAVKGKKYEPFKLVPEIMNELKTAINEEITHK